MGKSIRSKIKRKHRTEFRNTIGAEAAKANMNVVQSKLQECLDKGTMNSFERLSNVLSTGEVEEMETGEEALPSEPETASPPGEAKGENKVPTKKRREQKHRLRKKPREERKQERRKPKYFCAF